MSRWHRESCSAPVIVVKQRIPICKSCNATPDLKKIISEQSSERLSPSAIPADEPRGKLNLWWPPCVPYASSSCSATPTDDPAGGHYMWLPLCLPVGFKSPFSLLSRPMLSFFSDIRFELQNVLVRALVDEFVGTCHSRHHDFRNPVYPYQLKYNDLRLIRLTPVEDVDAPVHVDLEVHNGERYPEYETVSYTWGGEVCDSTICRPVYVGRHWDVLIQTHNCWEALRYLRPRRDVRTIWIDAICINQYDFQERETHVRNMGWIYENAIRTVVYLGPDLVLPTSASSPYSWRHYLQSLNFIEDRFDPMLPETRFQCTKRVTLAELLEREYFQRVWVIQELLLSRDVVFGIGNMEFSINRRWGLPPDPKPRPIMSLKSDRAPWFERITQGIILDERKNALFSAVELASKSKSTDPRDKIFGVLGMIEDARQLIPSYSISFQHLAMGYFAYCLTVKKDIQVILHAAGLQASATMPSWAPPAYKLGTNTPEIPNLSIDKGGSMISSHEFTTAYEKHHRFFGSRGEMERVEDMVEEMLKPLKGWPKLKRWGANDHNQTCWTLYCGQEVKSSLDLRVSFPYFANEDNRAGRSHDWHSSIKVDTLTGALLDLTAFHILRFDQSDLSLTDTYRNEGVYTYVFRAGTSSMLVYAQDACFELPPDPSETHLFALCDSSSIERQPGDTDNAGLSDNARLCILRSTVVKGTFKLVSAIVHVCFHTHSFLSKSCNLPSSVPHSVARSWDELQLEDISSKHIRLARDDASPTVIPVIRREIVDQILGANRGAFWDRLLETSELTRNQGSLLREGLYGKLSSIKQRFRETWLSQSRETLLSQNDLLQDHLKFLNFGGQLSPPNWGCFAFPRVTDPRDFLHLLHAAFLVENGVEGAVKSFLELYLSLVDEFQPRVLEDLFPAGRRISTNHPSELTKEDYEQFVLTDTRGLSKAARLWEIRQGSKPTAAAVNSEALVELCFKPHQLSVLEEVVNLAGRMGFKSTLITSQGEMSMKPRFLIIHYGEATTCQDDLDRPLVRFTAAEHHFMNQVTPGDFTTGREQETISSIRKEIYEHRGETIRVLFDLKMLITWAQLHPCTMAFRALTPYCRDAETELTLLLRDPLPEDTNVIVPWWPQTIIDEFGVNESMSLRKVVVV